MATTKRISAKKQTSINKGKMVLPCLRGVIGDWVYYSSLMSASQVADRILAVKDFREAKTLDEVLQRDLKDRTEGIAKYLLNEESRFFNSIIIGIFDGVPDWAEFDLSKVSSLIDDDEAVQNIEDSVGLLVFNGDEKMFAIDGQHRVAGIQIAIKEDLLLDVDNQVLKDDQFSVIFIAHIDDAIGRKRTRKLFSDINKNAKGVAEGDKIKIDEEDLNAIVTRKLYANYSFFNKGKLISLTENAKLEQNDTTHFTNLLGLNNTNKILSRLYRKAPKTKPWDEVNAIELYAIASKFYDLVINNVNDYKSYFLTKSLSLVTAREGNKYLLFRPIGLKLLARIYVYFVRNGKTPEQFISFVNKINFRFPDSQYANLLWNSKGNLQAKSANQLLAFDISINMLGDLDLEASAELLEKYRTAINNKKAKLPMLK